MAHEPRFATTPLSIVLLLATLAPGSVAGAERVRDPSRAGPVARSGHVLDPRDRAAPLVACATRVRPVDVRVEGRAAPVEPGGASGTLVAADATGRVRVRRTETVTVDASLEMPTGLTVLRYKPHVVLTWTHAGESTTGYEVERSLGIGKFRRIGTPGRDARTFRDRTSTPGFSYTYRIRAVGAGAVSPYSKEIIVVVEK